MELVALLLAGGVGLPIPEELVLVSGGWAIWRGAADAPTLFAAALAAVVAGDLALYALGRAGVRFLVGAGIGDARLARAEAAFARSGPRLLFVARFVPGLRAAFLVAAGAARLPLAALLAADALAACLGVALWLFVGAHFGARIDAVRAILGGARLVAIGAALLLALALLLRLRRH